MKMTKSGNMLMIFLATMIFVGCDNQTKQENDKQLEAEKAKLEEKLNKIQKDIDLKIDELTDASEKLKEDAKFQVNETISKLKQERSKISRLVEKVKSSSGDTFEKIEQETNETYDKVSKNVNQWTADIKSWIKEQKDKVES